MWLVWFAAVCCFMAREVLGADVLLVGGVAVGLCFAVLAVVLVA